MPIINTVFLKLFLNEKIFKIASAKLIVRSLIKLKISNIIHIFNIAIR